MWRGYSVPSVIPAECRILSVLIEREENVGSLAQLVGISESAIYHHLRSLRQLGSVQTRREGKEIYYRVDDEHLIAIFHEGLKHIQYE